MPPYVKEEMLTVRLIAGSLFLASRSLAMFESSNLSRLLTISLSGPTQASQRAVNGLRTCWMT